MDEKTLRAVKNGEFETITISVANVGTKTIKKDEVVYKAVYGIYNQNEENELLIEGLSTKGGYLYFKSSDYDNDKINVTLK